MQRRERAEKRREVEEFGPPGVLSTIFYGWRRSDVRWKGRADDPTFAART
ncbi:MAG: hypothetical protein ACYSUC_07315 [Planctomycetota bacterium]